MAKKPKTYDWNTADRETRKLWVRVLRQDGHSDEVIGEFFGITKNSVVGFRHRYLPELSFGTKATRPKVDPERFRDLLDIDEMDDMQERGVTPICPVSHSAPSISAKKTAPKRKLAASEKSQCTYQDRQGFRCAYEWSDPASKRCAIHPL